MNGIRVLLTGAGALLGQGILKCLRASPYVGHVVACDASPLAVGLYLADRACLLPKYTDANYTERVIAVAKRERVQAILCGTDLELGRLARDRATIERETGAKVVVSGEASIAIADDKWATVQFLHTSGFDAPRSTIERGDARAFAKDIGFPIVVKPRVGAGSIGLKIVRTLAELDAAFEDDNVIAQEYLEPDDEEYTVGTLVWNGVTRAVVPLRRTLRHGNTHTAECDGFDRIGAYAAKVAARLPDAAGPINLQLRDTKRGPIVFEINARFSGTTPLRAEFGYNEVEVVLRHVLFGETVPEPTLRRGKILRFATEVFVPFEQIETLRASGELERPGGTLLGILKKES